MVSPWAATSTSRSRSAATGSIFPAVTRTVLGHDVQRVEDPALLTGESRFVADLPEAGARHAVFVRSAVAHGVLRGIDTSVAASLPGVTDVLTARDLELPAQGTGELARPLLALDRVRFVGEAVAVVVAESYAVAVDGAEAVDVDIDALPAVVGADAAIAAGAPLLFPDHGTNVVAGRLHDLTDDFFSGDDVVVHARLHHPRLAPVT